MFYVINKSKIYSYLIALCTVVILFVAATSINDMVTGNTVETGTNVVEENKLNTNSISNNVTNDIATNKMVNNTTMANKTGF